jgi:hypothetical protein
VSADAISAVTTEVTDYGMELLPQHAALLRASGISPNVAHEREYVSVERKARLHERGFSARQQNVPALLIPLHGVDGGIAGYQARPDTPRIGKKNKPVKYEMPAGQRMVLDCHPRVRARLGDPHGPLLITEGVRKADAAITVGLDCVAVLGVWNWRGTNEQGGKAALADWEVVALNDRRVLIAFDSDVMVNRAVYEALTRLKSLLDSRGADVNLIYLAAGAAGEKVGLDDYLAAGHSPDDLLALASPELRRPPHDTDDERLYRLTSTGMIWRKPTREGPIDVQLTNFNALVETDLLHDDGVDQHRELELKLWQGSDDAPRTLHRIPADHLGSVDRWSMEALGVAASVSPGPMMRDHARAAVQAFSGSATRRTIYAHTGWRAVEGFGDVYLHASGAIGRSGSLENVDVELAAPLDRYVLPDPPHGDELHDAIGASVRLLELAPDAITFPLLAAVYRAAIGPSDFSLHLAGGTGVGKTELAALAQQHWGAGMDARHLPGSWSSTGNSLEQHAFIAKDALLVVDDFAPTGTRYDVARQHREADRLLRAQGNRAGRQRLRADTTLRPAKPPRGFVVSTGEDIPAGQSLRARMFVLEVEPHALDWAALTGAQRAASDGFFSGAMSAYVHWIAGRRDHVLANCRRMIEDTRTEIQVGHPRTAGIVAELLAGFETFLEFAQDIDILGSARAETLQRRAWAALVGAAAAHTAHQRDAEPTRRFFDLIGSAIASGRAHLATPNGSVPDDPMACGWRYRPIGDEGEWLPEGLGIGWIEDDDLYLNGPAALRAAREMASGADGLTVTERTLGKRLHERGLLKSTEPKRQTLKVRRTLEGRRHEVLHLRTAALGLSHDSHQADQPDQEGEAFTATQPMSGTATHDYDGQLVPRHLTTGQPPSHARPEVGLVGFSAGERSHEEARLDADTHAQPDLPDFELVTDQLHLNPDEDTEEQGQWTW